MPGPSLEEFLQAAKPANPGVSDEALGSYWKETYGGSTAVPAPSMPSLESFMKKAKPENPNVPDAELHSYWQENYGVHGAPKEEGSDFVRGAKVALKQTAPLAEGAVGLIGATMEKATGEGGIATKVKNWGLTGYEEGMKKLAPDQRENDDVQVAWQKAKSGDLGALVDWSAYALGYGLGQLGETVGVAALGAVAGSALGPEGTVAGAAGGTVAKTATKGFVKNLIEKEVAKRADAMMVESAGKGLAREAAVEAATKSVARDIGAAGALTVYNVGQEMGTIYPTAVEEAAKHGEKVDGGDLARIWGTATLAGLSESATDMLGIQAAHGRIRIPGAGGNLARAAVGALAGGGVESGQELFQTYLERVGAKQSTTDDEAIKDYVNSAAMAFLPGALVGGVSGGLHGNRNAPGFPLPSVNGQLPAPGALTAGPTAPESPEAAAQRQAADANAEAVYAGRSAEEARQGFIRRVLDAGTVDEAIHAAEEATRPGGLVSRYLTRANEFSQATAQLDGQKEGELDQVQAAQRQAEHAETRDLDLARAAGDTTFERPSSLAIAMRQAMEEAKSARGRDLLQKMEALERQKGETNAGSVRSDEGQVRGPGPLAQGGGAEVGANLQRAPAAGSNPNGAELRAAGEARTDQAGNGEKVGLPATKRQLFVQRGGQRFQVGSLEEASQKWNQFRDSTMAGASEIGEGAKIVDQHGKEVARISYNGKVWPPGEFTPGQKPLVGEPFRAKSRDEINAQRIEDGAEPLGDTVDGHVAAAVSNAREMHQHGIDPAVWLAQAETKPSPETRAIVREIDSKARKEHEAGNRNERVSDEVPEGEAAAAQARTGGPAADRQAGAPGRAGALDAARKGVDAGGVPQPTQPGAQERLGQVRILGKRPEELKKRELEVAARKSRTKAQRAAAQVELDRRARAAENRPAKPTKLPGSEFLQAVRNAGGIDPSFAAEVGGDAAHILNRRLPGLFRKGGMSEDGLMEWAREQGYLHEAQIRQADRTGTGGAMELAKGLVRKAMNGEEVHRIGSEEDAYATTEEERWRSEAEYEAHVAGLPQEEVREVGEAVASQDAPDSWATMAEADKDAYLDNLFGPAEAPLAQGEGGRAPGPEGKVQQPGRETGEDDEDAVAFSRARPGADAVKTLEDRFGSDEALGTIFPPESEDRPSHFADGRDAVVCTNCAIQVVRALGKRAQIWGFSEDENPTARVVREAETGHDFALVDGRYLVDPWIKLVPEYLPRAVYDLQNPHDAKLVAEWYGPRDKWSRLSQAEAIANKEYDERGNERPALELKPQTESELKAKQDALDAAARKKSEDEAAAEARRKADAERDSFSLSGSDRAADVAAAGGQKALFSRKPKGELIGKDVKTVDIDGTQRAAVNSSGRLIAATKEALRNFWNWFGNSKTVDAKGQPIMLFHGARRLDRLGSKINPKRATSGPMPFFTDDPAIASNYSTSKGDTSLANEDVWNYDSWFRMKLPGQRAALNLDRAWHFLTSEQRARIAELAPQITRNDEGEIIVEPGNTRGIGNYDHEIKVNRGNAFKSLIEGWLSGGVLFDDENEFFKVLKLAGVDTTNIEMHDPNAEFPGVLPTYLAVKNPLLTNAVPDNVVRALEQRAARSRTRAEPIGADPWSKTTRDVREWVAQLKEDVAAGRNSTVWTSIPDLVTDTLRSMGYDGIHDAGGKMGGKGHDVWIPFGPTQVKSAIGNRGTFDPSNKNILFSRAPTTPEVAKVEELRGRVLDLQDAIGAVNRDIGRMNRATARERRHENFQPTLRDLERQDNELRRALSKAERELTSAEKALTKVPPLDDSRNQGTLFSRAPTFERTEDGPVLVGDGRVGIVQPSLWETRHGMTMYEHTIAKDGEPIGVVTLGWVGDKAAFLPNIRLYPQARKQGVGEAVVRALVEHNGPGQELTIGFIAPSARDFWSKMGVKIEDTDEGTFGVVTLESYRDARPEQASSDAQRSAPGEGSQTGTEGEGKPRAYRGPAPAAAERRVGLTPSAVRQAIAPILKAWGNAPDVRVLDSIEDAPEAVQRMDEAQRSQGAAGAPEAFIYRNTVYMVSEGIDSPAAAQRALLHESVGHFGLRNVFGERLDPILDDVAKSLAGRVEAKAKEYGLDLANVDERRQAAEEVLAEMAQSMPKAGVVQRLVAAIRQFLREIGVDLELTDNDIISNFILPAREFVTRSRSEETGAEPLATAGAFGRDQTATRTFKKWFGDSKVVEPDGKPLVVYHGTGSKFTAFDMKKSLDGAHFFTADDVHASSFGQNVGAYYVSIQNPLEISQEDLEAAWDKEHPDGEQDDRNLLPRDFVGQFVKQAKKAGNDGLIIRNMGDRDVQVDMFLPFKPGQIKSATDNRGTFDAKNSDTRMQRDRPWYYSALQKSIEGLKQASAPAAQWKATIKALKGVSPDEIAWSGIDDWLDLQGGKVTREQVIGYLAQNGVKVEETLLGENTPGEARATAEVDQLKVELDALGYSIDTAPDTHTNELVLDAITDRKSGYTYPVDGGGIDESVAHIRPENLVAGQEPVQSAPELPTRVRDIVDRLRELEFDMPIEEGSSAKFGQYTLPGGKNYRELLLTLPVEDELPPGFKVIERSSYNWGIEFPNGSIVDGWRTRDAAIESQRRQAGNPTFRSSHFDQPNILAHVRFDERTDADGKKVLFIEEIQSDWAQKGKREGFKGAFPDEVLKAAIAGGMSESSARADIEHLMKEPVHEDDRPTWDQWKRLAAATRDSGIDLNDVFHDRKDRAVPSAPFVGKTDAWVSLALKRMIKWAADNGFDRVAWTTGEQQVRRYDLSQHISRIMYGWSDKADQQIGIEVFDLHGSSVADRVTKPEQLPDLVGKEMTDRILADLADKDEKYDGKIEGLNLKVGGDGMRAFYDKIIPSVANKLLAKLGGERVGEVRLEKTDGTQVNKKELADQIMAYMRGDLNTDEFIENAGLEGVVTEEQVERDLEGFGGLARNQRGRAREVAQNYAERIRHQVAGQKAGVQSGFDITPAMKEAAGTGLPLFSRAKAAPGPAPQPAAPSGREPKWVSALTPQQQEAVRRVAHLQDKTWREKVDELRQNAWGRLRQGIVDQFDPIKTIDYRAYMMARMSKASDQGLEAMMLFGKPFIDQGALNVNYEPKGGLINVLQQLQGEHDRFLIWVAAKRAAQLKAEGRENLFTDPDIAMLSNLNQGKMADGQSREAVYLKTLKEFNGYGKAVLDIAEATGLIDPESRKVWEKDFYVPFYRQMEEGRSGPTVSTGLVNQYAFKSLKGGREQLRDLLANTLANWSHLLSASMKNQAALASLKAAEKIGVARSMPAAASPKGAIKVMDGGKPRTYAVEDPFLLDAISAIEWIGFGGPAMKVLSTTKRWLTAGVTASPVFKIRNLIRDTVSAIGQGELSYNPFKNISEGWAATKHGSEEQAHMLAGGGIFRFGTMLEGSRAQYVKRLIDEGVDSATILDTKDKVKNFIKDAWERYEEFGDRSENINRAALYKQMRARGADHLEASYAARDLLDFSLQGKWAMVRFLTQVVPFMNARLQGLYKLGRAAAENPQRVAYVVGAATLMSVALLAMYHDDEDWKRREDWDRDNFWWVKIGGVAVRIPKPFEIGALASFAERAMELVMSKEKDKGKRFAGRIAAILGDNLSMNPIPQLVKPMIELYANKDMFTGRPIESMGMERLSPKERISRSTTMPAVLLGKQDVLSPVQIDHLVRAYFGWMGASAVTALDYGIRSIDGTPRPEMKLKDVFLAGNFVETLPTNSSRYLTVFYNSAQAIEQAYGDYRQALKLGDVAKAREILQDNRDKLQRYSVTEAAKRRLGEINAMEQRVLASKILSPDTKRRILDNYEQRKHEIARQATR